jgi:hypothetical protein
MRSGGHEHPPFVSTVAARSGQPGGINVRTGAARSALLGRAAAGPNHCQAFSIGALLKRGAAGSRHGRAIAVRTLLGCTATGPNHRRAVAISALLLPWR